MSGGGDRGAGRGVVKDSRPDRFAAVGGRRAVAEAIRSGRVDRLLIARGSSTTEGLRSVLAEAERKGIVVQWVDHAAIDGLGVGNHQGVAAMVKPPRELDERALSAASFAPDALVVVLDGVTDPQNLGACARSAEAAGAAMLVSRKRRAAPLSPGAVKASAGALFHLPMARVANISRSLERLKDRGFFVVGLDQRARSDIHHVPPPSRPLALVVGAEDVGLSRLVRETCDELVAIPMAGRTSSLNASAALAVALFGYALRPPE
jgi:23S rRNA (guanosine2251-2'-O)-methyltransferase